jgi:excisionase family DNA binding protein
MPTKSRVRRFRRLPANSAPPPDKPEPKVEPKVERVTYSMGEFCQRFGIHHDTARRWIKAGVVRAIRIRGRHRIPVSEERRLLAGAKR